MKRASMHIWLSVYFCLLSIALSAQESVLLDRSITLTSFEASLLEHIDNIYNQENIILAFNSSRVDLDEVIKLPNKTQSLRSIIKLLFYKNDIKLITSDNKVIITFLNERVSESLTIRGYIRDSSTGEVLVGASIVEINSSSSTFSNESGFYSLTIPIESNNINFHYLGYKSLSLQNVKESSLNISLEFDNEIDQIVIEGSISDNFIEGSGSEKIDLSHTNGFQSLSGDNDVIRAVRVSPKVQSGNEGQVGLYVRGGGPDQNLILFDGIPLYEVSHTAGFSSIFIEESIKDIDFISNGFPARYGGRLSSVMNVRLKDGNQFGYNGSVKFSLPAMKAHVEGPLFSPKTTFNLSGRLSYVDKYLNQLIGDIVNYDNINLDYNDFVGKLTHRFSPTQKFSFSYYTGKDDIGLLRNNSTLEDDGSLFETSSNSTLRWGSTVWNAKFTNVISDKFQLMFNVGGISYNNDSKATFSINSIIDNLASPQELELVSHSQIKDQMASVNLDYYLNDQHRIKIGGSWIQHTYNPALYGNDTITTDDQIKIISERNQVLADELAFYVEDTYRPHENLQIYGGLHFSGYNIGEQKYRNVQPRFSTVFTPDASNRLTFSYSKMMQYIHLLVNPGIGLPSDFWIPSTETLEPESAVQFSFDYTRKLNNYIEVSLSAYTKRIENVLDYRNSTALFFNFVNNVSPPSIQIDPDWENFVVAGLSDSRGLEFLLRKTTGKFTGWASYALSRTNRQFEEIDSNRVFPYKYDRRHDINIGLEYKIDKNCSVSMNWVYGTGNAFSLANEQIETPFPDEDGNPLVLIVSTGDRNNFRFPDFSHLDFQFNYNKEVKGGKLSFNLGLYNVYNRKNGYYIYVYNNPTKKNNVAYKTSLFPILPNMSLGYSF